jgi:hypothetical protein
VELEIQPIGVLRTRVMSATPGGEDAGQHD